MSTEQLKADIVDSGKRIAALDPATATAADLVRLLKDTLWPTVEAVVDEIEDIDGSVEELADTLDGEAEYLSEATGSVFAGIIAAGLAIVGEAEKVATLPDPLKQAIKEFRQLCKQGAEKLEEIVIPDAEADDAEGDEIDTDDEEDGDDD